MALSKYQYALKEIDATILIYFLLDKFFR